MFDTLHMQPGEEVVLLPGQEERSIGVLPIVRRTGVVEDLARRAFAFVRNMPAPPTQKQLAEAPKKGVIVDCGRRMYGRTRCFGIRPGLYYDRSVVVVTFDDDPAKKRISLPSHLVALADAKKEEARQRAKFLVPDAAWRTEMEKDFLSPIPRTPFWEGDVVRLRVGAKKRPVLRVIVDIDYEVLQQRGADGSVPAYGVAESSGDGPNRICATNELELFERGNVWRKLHGEPLRFQGDDPVGEEFVLALDLGSYDVVLPGRDVSPCRWTRSLAVRALHQGRIDWLLRDHQESDLGPAASTSTHTLHGVKFHDQELGIRLTHRALRALSK